MHAPHEVKGALLSKFGEVLQVIIPPEAALSYRQGYEHVGKILVEIHQKHCGVQRSSILPNGGSNHREVGLTGSKMRRTRSSGCAGKALSIYGDSYWWNGGRKAEGRGIVCSVGSKMMNVIRSPYHHHLHPFDAESVRIYISAFSHLTIV